MRSWRWSTEPMESWFRITAGARKNLCDRRSSVCRRWLPRCEEKFRSLSMVAYGAARTFSRHWLWARRRLASDGPTGGGWQPLDSRESKRYWPACGANWKPSCGRRGRRRSPASRKHSSRLEPSQPLRQNDFRKKRPPAFTGGLPGEGTATSAAVDLAVQLYSWKQAAPGCFSGG